MTLHAGHLQLALLRYLDWPGQIVMFEYEIDGGRADVISISRSRYLAEYEIKTSLADFRKDREKLKWAAHRAHVSRFFYVVPAALAAKVLQLLEPGQGLIAVDWRTTQRTEIPRSRKGKPLDPSVIGVRSVYAREIQAAARTNAIKISEQQVSSIYRDCYFRHWRAREQSLKSRIDIQGVIRSRSVNAALWEAHRREERV